MSRVPLASIPALTFYKDSWTESRRTSPISQLTCIGKPCQLYQPEVVRCVNLAGFETDVVWKVCFIAAATLYIYEVYPLEQVRSRFTGGP